jgi:hypothetical protein
MIQNLNVKNLKTKKIVIVDEELTADNGRKVLCPIVSQPTEIVTCITNCAWFIEGKTDKDQICYFCNDTLIGLAPE